MNMKHAGFVLMIFLYVGSFIIIQLFLPPSVKSSYAQTALPLEDKETYRAYLLSLGDQNRVSPVEPAGAHGLDGWRMGAGISTSSVSKKGQKLLSNELAHTERDNIDLFILPKFWLTKGLIYPIDIGFSFGSTLSYPYTHAGGYLQWTVYEALARPALALRTSYSRIFGLANTEISTTSIGVLTSWGIAFITAYIGYGFHQHNAQINSSPKTNFIQSDEINTDLPQNKDFHWTETTTTAGIQLQLIPPFVQLAFEGTLSDQKTQSYQGKISIGL